MSSAPKTLFEKYGGKSTVEKMVKYFYEELVLKDSLVSGFFTKTDMELQKKRQTNFVTFALGGTDKYTGKTMKQSHQNMHIKNEHFYRIIDHLTTTFKVHGVDPQDIAAIQEKLNSFHDDIVEEPTSADQQVRTLI